MSPVLIEQIEIAKLIPYANNARTHSEEQIAQIAASIREFGFNNPVLIDEQSTIVAGHGRVLAARKLELDIVPCIRLNHLSDNQKKSYIIADNKIALNAGWNEELLALELNELTELGVNIDLTGFTVDELLNLNIETENDELDNPYSTKIEAPIYEPTDEKPNIEDLYNDEKATRLIEDINNSKLSKEEKFFLISAASRHIVFNYEKVANFYAHSPKECQELMENSALVIIDFNKAIEQGLVRIKEEIEKMHETEDDE